MHRFTLFSYTNRSILTILCELSYLMSKIGQGVFLLIIFPLDIINSVSSLKLLSALPGCLASTFLEDKNVNLIKISDQLSCLK